MARDPILAKSLEKFRKNLASVIDDRSRRICKETTKDIAQLFVDRASKRLLRKATPADSSSMAKVQAIADSMVASQTNVGSVATIPIDKDNLVMYLEYGTGLVGSVMPNPDASKRGWQYMVHKENYKLHNSGWGWFFSSDKNPYIDMDDEHPVIVNKEFRSVEYVEPYFRNGNPVSGYIRHNTRVKAFRQRPNTVFSSGLYPIRFIYDTKQEIRELFNSLDRDVMINRKYPIEYIKEKIEELRNKEL